MLICDMCLKKLNPFDKTYLEFRSSFVENHMLCNKCAKKIDKYIKYEAVRHKR